MRALNRLSVAEVKARPKGKCADGGGLWLFKGDEGGGKRVLRVTVHGRRREMGLGPIRDVSLKEAREAAANWRSMVRQGLRCP